VKYLLDIFIKPPVVVLASDDDDEVLAVGKKYADQVGRPLVVADGPMPADAQFLPTIPVVMPASPDLPSNPANVVPTPEADTLTFTFDRKTITDEQRRFVEALGAKVE
jgi:hypothetical protein